MRVHHGNGQTFKKIILANGLEGEGGNIINVNGTHHRVQPPIPLPLLYRTVHSWGSLRPVNAIVVSFLDFKKGGKNINGRKNSNSESFFSRWLIFFFFQQCLEKKMNLDDWIGLGYVLLTQGPQQRLRFGPYDPGYPSTRWNVPSIRFAKDLLRDLF